MRRNVRDEGGFTLLELMVVVLIISILIAVSVPVFNASRRRAQDQAAQVAVSTGMRAEMVFFSDAEVFSEDNAAGGALESIEPSLVWGSLDASVSGVTASLPAGEPETVILRSRSVTGTIFCLANVSQGASAGTYVTTGCDGTETGAAITAGWTPASQGW
ncbi:MAG TPA: type II secretion system protein [Actinomycetota bacterium]